MTNPETAMTLDQAVAEVFGILTGLDLEYEPEQDRYQAIVRQINRALRGNALEHEWSWYSSTETVGTTYVGMREVDRDTVEAARGMGMTPLQLLRTVELPLAVPLILTGLRLAVVQVWATATIAALVAGPGLGRIVTLGFVRQDVSQVVGAALAIAVCALLLEVALLGVQNLVDPVARARRSTGAAAAPRVVGESL